MTYLLTSLLPSASHTQINTNAHTHITSNNVALTYYTHTYVHKHRHREMLTILVFFLLLLLNLFHSKVIFRTSLSDGVIHTITNRAARPIDHL